MRLRTLPLLLVLVLLVGPLAVGIASSETKVGSKVGMPGRMRLEQSIKATDNEPATVSERWEVRDQSGGTVTLALEYTRALPARNKGEAKVYGGPDPVFFRIYRTDAGADVLRSVPTGVDRVKKLSLRVTIPDLKKAFDGSEQIVSVTAIPWYGREVALP